MITRAVLSSSLVLLVACAPAASPGPTPAAEAKRVEPAPPAAGAPEAKGDAAPARPAAVEGHPALAKICAEATCAGPFSRVEVLRKDGAVVGYVHFGDIQRCSHPPATYFDPGGVQTGAIGERPIVPGSPEAQEIEAQRARFSAGGQPGETLSCPER